MSPSSSSPHRSSLYFLAFALLLTVAVPTRSAGAVDPRIQALNDFLWSRTQANGVVEYTYMTDSLRDYFHHDRSVKIRQESSVLLTFRYDPHSLQEEDGGKKFVVDVVGTWKNLNEHLIGDLDERDTFVRTPTGWLADEVKFGKEVPTPLAILDGFDAPKEYSDAMRVLKIVMRAWVERDFASAEKLLSPDFEREFRSRDELRRFVVGPPNPRHVAFAIRRISRLDDNHVGFDVDLYEMAQGDPRLSTGKGKLEIKQYDSTWLVEDWTINKTSPAFQ